MADPAASGRQAASLKPCLPTRLPPPLTAMAPRSSPVQMLWPGAQPSASFPCWCGRESSASPSCGTYMSLVPLVWSLVIAAARLVLFVASTFGGYYAWTLVQDLFVERELLVGEIERQHTKQQAKFEAFVAPSTTKDKLPSLDAKTIESVLWDWNISREIVPGGASILHFIVRDVVQSWYNKFVSQRERRLPQGRGHRDDQRRGQVLQPPAPVRHHRVQAPVAHGWRHQDRSRRSSIGTAPCATTPRRRTLR